MRRVVVVVVTGLTLALPLAVVGQSTVVEIDTERDITVNGIDAVDAYLAGGVRASDQCNLLIAFWNGEKAAGVRGAGDIVDYSCDVGEFLDTRGRGQLGGISCQANKGARFAVALAGISISSATSATGEDTLRCMTPRAVAVAVGAPR